MNLAEKFLKKIDEAAHKIKREVVIKDGHKEVIEKKEYVTDLPNDSYKRDSETGDPVRMTMKERRDRSIAASKGANKSSTKRNRAMSMRRRDALIKDK